MGSFIQALALTMAGIFLLWFGYTLFFGSFSYKITGKKRKKRRPAGEGVPGAPRTCPVCSAKLEVGEMVKSVAFPSLGGYDRLMYISGCVYCLEGDRTRSCPVCNTILLEDEFLVARLFDKPYRSHVHVIGCSHCKKVKSKQPLQVR